MKKKMMKTKGYVIFLLCLLLMCFTNVYGYSAAGNKLNTNYTLSGNGAEDICAVAKAQLGKKYPEFAGFTYRAWCADFVSACAVAANVSDAIPGTASVSNLRTNIVKAGGTEHSKAQVQNGSYTPARGDIIIFKSNGDSHVGIVDKAENGRIYYIDGNNTVYGNGNNASVHYSNRAYSYAGFTCVVRPNYKEDPNPDPSYTDFSVSQSVYSLHDKIEFRINPINATNMGFGIDKDGVGRVVTGDCNAPNGHSLWASDLGVGNYSAYITVYNKSKWVDTNVVKFSVVPPEYSSLSINKKRVGINESVQFNISTSHTAWMAIGIDKKAEGRVYTVRCGDSVSGWSVDAGILGVGNYTAYFTLYGTNDCYVDTERISFSIYDPNGPRGSEMTSGYDRVLPDGDYIIASAADPRYYLDIEGNAVPAQNGTNVSLCGPMNGEPPEHDIWTIRYSDGFYRITQKGADVSLDVEDIETLQGANVQVWVNNDTSAQKWAISGNSRNGYQIQAKCSGYALDIFDGKIRDGVNIWQYHVNDGFAQEWMFIPYKPAQDITDGRYVLLSDMDRTLELDVAGDTGDLDNETNVQIWKDTALSKYNSFDITKLDNGYYKIIHAASGKALNLQDGVAALEGNISLHDDNGSTAQQWAITNAGGDSFILWSRCSGMVMDVKYSQTANGTNVFQYAYNGGANQKWHFVKAEYTVTYNAMEGQGNPEKQTKYYKADLKLSTVVPQRKGYIFKGWNDAPNLKGAVYAPGSTYIKDNDLQLYAIWEKDHVPVLSLSQKNGALVASVSNTDYVTEYGFVYGKQKNITLNTPGRTRIAYSNLDSSGSYSFDATELTGCTIRAYVVYTDEAGTAQVIYSDSISR